MSLSSFSDEEYEDSELILPTPSRAARMIFPTVPPRITSLSDTAEQLRKLCSTEPVDGENLKRGLTEHELYEKCLGTLFGTVVKNDTPRVLLISSNLLQRTVIRLKLIRAGFSVVETHDITEENSKQLQRGTFNTVLVDVNGCLNKHELAVKVKLLQHENHLFVPLIAILTEQTEGCESTDELNPLQLLSLGYDLFCRHPLDNIINTHLAEVFLSNDRRVTESLLASSNYKRICTILAEVTDRSLHKQVKESSKAYKGVVKGTVQTHPMYLKAQSEIRQLHVAQEEQEEITNKNEAEIRKLKATVGRLSSQLSQKNIALEQTEAARESDRKLSLQILEDTFMNSDSLSQTPLAARLRFDREILDSRNKLDQLSSRLSAATAENTRLKSEIQLHKREQSDLITINKELKSKIEFERCKQEARSEEGYVPVCVDVFER